MCSPADPTAKCTVTTPHALAATPPAKLVGERPRYLWSRKRGATSRVRVRLRYCEASCPRCNRDRMEIT